MHPKSLSFTHAILSAMPHGYNFGFHTKGDGVKILAEHYGLSLEDFVGASAAMDDGDLTLIGDPAFASQYLLVAAPANAKSGVQAHVRTQGERGFVSEQTDFAAFREAYALAAQRGAKVFITDVDGCLRDKDSTFEATTRDHIVPQMGGGMPLLVPITGSSYLQNQRWAVESGFGDVPLSASYGVPFVMALENGGALYNPRTGNVTNMIEVANRDLFGRFAEAVAQVRVRTRSEIAPRFGFAVALRKDDRVIYPSGEAKTTMDSQDIPRTVDGAPYRDSPEGRTVRGALVRTVLEECDRVGLPVIVTPTSRDWADLDEIGGALATRYSI